ncbi:lipase family protein [Nocardia thailandica]
MTNTYVRRVVALARRAGTAVGAGLLLAAAASGPVVAEPLYPAPDPDPFYAQPADLGAASPGQVLGLRRMPDLPMFPDTTVTVVRFRSTDSTGGPIAATTTVLQPAQHRRGGPLLSYQHIINALGAKCSVSHVLYTSDPDLQIREAPTWNVLLRQGWTMVLPDHLGPTFAYGAARLGGQVTLDSLRAVRSVADFDLADSPIGMAGYSGGGMATAWAAALAPDYAPELTIAGAAMGGVPMNLIAMLEGLGFGGHPAFGLAMAAGIGLEREYRDRFPIGDQLNARGLALRAAVADSCTNNILTEGAGKGIMDVASTTRMIDSPEARAVVEENSLELFPGVPATPIFEWHSGTDVLIPVDAITRTMRRWCEAGARVRSEAVISPDHLTAALIGLPGAVSWLDARMRGEPAPTNC